MKLHRAGQIVSQLVVLQREYLASDAVRLEASRTPHGPAAQRIRIDRSPPAEFSRLAGTAIHTARSALDELAVSLVIASRRTPRNTSFPIARSAHDFAAEENRCLRRASQKARDAVRSVTPWKGGDAKLWELHHLDTAGEDPAQEPN